MSLIGYLLIRFWFPLTPRFNHVPLADIRTFTPSLGAGLGYALLLGLLYALYGLAYRRVREMGKPPSLAAILLTAVLFSLPLLQTYPINATDIYRYFIRGRISSVYHQSPFSQPPNSFDDDPYRPLAGEWANATSPYGPIWEITAAAITRVSHANLYLGLLMFKGLGLFLHLAITGLIWSLAGRLGIGDWGLGIEDWRLNPQSAIRNPQSAMALLWAWNPALLLTFVVDAHNDGFMLFWLLLGLWVARRGRPAAGFILMALAPLTKPIGLLPLPLFFLAIWREMPDLRAKIRFLLLAVAGSLAAVWFAFLPFGSPLDLARRLLREASSGGGFSMTVLIVFVARLLKLDLSVAQANTATTVLFGLAVLWLFWLTWRGRAAVRGTADIFFAYILQALNFRLWYTTWPFAWLLLDRDGGGGNGRLTYRLRAGLWLLLTTQLSVLIYGHLRVYLLGGSHLLAHIIGVPFTFGLPFLLAQMKDEGVTG